MLANLSIKVRLLLLSSALIVVITASTLYLTRKLADNSEAVTRNAELAKLIDVAQDVRNTFGEYRYWITDLAVSLLRQSEINAKATHDRMIKQLDVLAGGRSEIPARLNAVVAAIDGVTAGRLNTPIPKVRGGEIGAMARTLELFRESIVERERLAAETERQRRMIATAIETISEGFVLYDPQDRLVLCNS